MRGTVLFFNPEKHFGRIRPDDGGPAVFVHVSELVKPDRALKEGDQVEFAVLQNEKGPYATGVLVLDRPRPVTAAPMTNCFVVMPFGHTPDEIRWFSGWYKMVIEEGVRAAGFQPILSAAQQRPDAINDEIRAHLALDPMVVIDLGGLDPQDAPNPNVMYELGIRHAFNLPHVIMAWEGQRLPFDISNQRVIMERRDLIDVPVNRDRLTKFLREASIGNHYRPMDAVGRAATLERAEERLGPETVLGALVEEVRELRSRISFGRRGADTTRARLKGALGDNDQRNEIRRQFLLSGGTQPEWDRLMSQKIDHDLAATLGGSSAKVDLLLQLAKRYPPKRSAAVSSGEGGTATLVAPTIPNETMEASTVTASDEPRVQTEREDATPDASNGENT